MLDIFVLATAIFGIGKGTDSFEIEIPAAAHGVQFENPQTFNDALLEFLAHVEKAGAMKRGNMDTAIPSGEHAVGFCSDLRKRIARLGGQSSLWVELDRSMFCGPVHFRAKGNGAVYALLPTLAPKLFFAPVVNARFCFYPAADVGTK